jgi:hypothetical protein
MLAMTYGHVYVARVAFGRQGRADRPRLPGGRGLPRPVADHRLQPLHRPRLRHGPRPEQQRLAVESGVWPLYRFDPRRLATGEAPLKLDSSGADQGRCATTCATRAASAWSSSRTRSATRAPGRGRARRRRSPDDLRAARRPDLNAPDVTEPGKEKPDPMDLSTHLPRPRSEAHPLMPGASPLVDDLDMVRRLEDAGASAIVMHSLFEEQVEREQLAAHRTSTRTPTPTPRPSSYFPRLERLPLGPDAYLEQIRQASRGGEGAGDRLAQRRDPDGGWLATPGSSRRPARTRSSSTSTTLATDPTDERRRGRGAHPRHGARGARAR